MHLLLDRYRPRVRPQGTGVSGRVCYYPYPVSGIRFSERVIPADLLLLEVDGDQGPVFVEMIHWTQQVLE